MPSQTRSLDPPFRDRAGPEFELVRGPDLLTNPQSGVLREPGKSVVSLTERLNHRMRILEDDGAWIDIHILTQSEGGEGGAVEGWLLFNCEWV